MEYRKMGRPGLVAASVVVTALALAACSDAPGDDGGTGAPGEGVTLRVGVIEANNSTFGLVSEGARVAGEIAPELIQIPGVTVETVPIPTDGTPENVVQSVQRAVQQEGITAVTGFLTSGASAALSAQADQLGVVQFDAISRNPALTGADCRANYFRVSLNSDQLNLATIAAAKSGQAESWDAYAWDTENGHSAIDSFTQALGGSGSMDTVVFPPAGITDFAPYISTLAENPADALLLVTGGTDAVNFATQANQFGLFDDYDFVVGSGVLIPQAIDANGDALVGIQEVYDWVPDNGAPGAEAFTEKYESSTDTTPAWYTPADIFIAIEMAANAAAKAGSAEPEALIEAAAGSTFDTIGGSIELRAGDHQGLRDGFLVEVVDDGGQATLQTISTIPAADITPPVSPACSL